MPETDRSATDRQLQDDFGVTDEGLAKLTDRAAKDKAAIAKMPRQRGKARYTTPTPEPTEEV